MSWVTVKVPWAPDPLACMRRSGITSRWKCASFSISQTSWSNAGPRGPAVKMFTLSVTGAPDACVRNGLLVLSSISVSLISVGKLKSLEFWRSEGNADNVLLPPLSGFSNRTLVKDRAYEIEAGPSRQQRRDPRLVVRRRDFDEVGADHLEA